MAMMLLMLLESMGRGLSLKDLENVSEV